MSLTCKTLRVLSLPVIFSHLKLTLHTIPVHVDWQGRCARSPAVRRWIARKLEFYRDNRIKTLVRKCSVVSNLWIYEKPADWITALENTIFSDLLRHFPKLGALELRTICLDTERLKSLQTLQALNSVALCGCKIDTAVPSPLFIDHLYLSGRFNWQAVCKFHHLKSLKIYDPERHPFPNDFGFVNKDMPRLRTLEIIGPPQVLGKYGNLLRGCPRLEYLTIIPRGSFPFVMPAVRLSHLKSYEGSVYGASVFLHAGSVLHLSFCCPEETTEMHWRLNLLAMHNPQLQSLHLSVTAINRALLDAINEFPVLQSLKIIHYPAHDSTQKLISGSIKSLDVCFLLLLACKF